MKEDGCGICLQGWRYLLRYNLFITIEKVSRRTLKKQDKNKGEPQLKGRWVFHREKGILSGNILCVSWTDGLWWKQVDKREGERKERALEMGLLVSGERESKGYRAAQLVHEIWFHFGSSLFPEKEEENDATLCWCSHKRNYFVLCQLLSKLMMLRENDHRWSLSFRKAIASSGFLWISLVPCMGHQLALLLPSFVLSSMHLWGKDSVKFRINWLTA